MLSARHNTQFCGSNDNHGQESTRNPDRAPTTCNRPHDSLIWTITHHFEPSVFFKFFLKIQKYLKIFKKIYSFSTEGISDHIPIAVAARLAVAAGCYNARSPTWLP